MIDFRSMNPFRSADWRWKLAEQHRAGREQAGSRQDPVIADATRFLWALGTLGDVAVARKWADLSSAHSIYRAGGVVRDEIEARMLTAETFEVIASKTGVSVSVLRVFEHMFFNVRDALNAGDWLISEVVRIIPGQPVSEGQVWKYLALAAGPVLLDVMVDDFFNRPGPDCEKRSKWAAMGRFTVRDFATDWDSDQSVRSLIEEGRCLLPHIYGNRRLRKQDPIFQIHRDMIALLYASAAPNALLKPLKELTTKLPRRKPRKDTSHGRRKTQESIRPVALTA